MAKYNLLFKTTLDSFLKSKKFVEDNQLKEIQRVRNVEGGGWAGHFVDSGCLTENELLRLIVEETGLPYIPLLGVTPPEELLKEFTLDFLKAFECFPIDKIGHILTIATPNPFQQELLRSRHTEDCRINLFVCRVSEWREKIRLMKQAEQK